MKSQSAMVESPLKRVSPSTSPAASLGVQRHPTSNSSSSDIQNPRPSPIFPTSPPMSNLPLSQPSNPSQGFRTGFRSAPIPRREISSSSEGPLALPAHTNCPVAGMFPGQARPLAWAIYDSLTGAYPNTRLVSLRMSYALWFHPLAVRDEELAQSYTDDKENLPGDLPGVITMSWDWGNRIAIPVHHVRRNAGESTAESHATLVRLAHLRPR